MESCGSKPTSLFSDTNLSISSYTFSVKCLPASGKKKVAVNASPLKSMLISIGYGSGICAICGAMELATLPAVKHISVVEPSCAEWTRF